MGFVPFPPFAVVVFLLSLRRLGKGAGWGGLLFARVFLNDAAPAADSERWWIRLMSVTSLPELSSCNGLILRDYPIKFCSRICRSFGL